MTTAPGPRHSSRSRSRSLRALKPRQQIRFAWWGGEEEGLIGSTYYAEHLNPREVAKIMVMLDFDMISSPNFARLVYDGDGSVDGQPRGAARFG